MAASRSSKYELQARQQEGDARRFYLEYVVQPSRAQQETILERNSKLLHRKRRGRREARHNCYGRK